MSHRPRRTFVVGFALFALGILVVAADTSTARAEEPGHAVGEIHRRGRYPDDLLVAPPRGAQGATVGSAPQPIFGGRNAPPLAPDPPAPWDLPDWDLSFLGWLKWLAYVVLGVCVAALVAALVYLLYRLRDAVPELEGRAQGSSGGAGDAVADPLLAMPTLSHEELARLGRFAEAVHALLIASLLRTGWSPEGRGRGLTAREIVRAYDRPSAVRSPLVELLRLVERVWFGGREATQETYAEALALHAAFDPQGGPTPTAEGVA